MFYSISFSFQLTSVWTKCMWRALLLPSNFWCFPSHHLTFVFRYAEQGFQGYQRKWKEENDGGRNGAVPHKHSAGIRFQQFCAPQHVSVGRGSASHDGRRWSSSVRYSISPQERLDGVEDTGEVQNMILTVLLGSSRWARTEWRR